MAYFNESALDAEKMLLSTFLLDPKEYEKLHPFLSEELFTIQNTRILYKAITDLYSKHVTPDMITVGNYLRENKLSSRLSFSELVDYYEYSPTASNGAYFFEIIKERYLKDTYDSIAMKLHTLSKDTTKTSKEIYEETLNLILTMKTSQSTQGFETVTALLEKYIDQYEKHDINYIPTGYKSLDSILNGFYNGNLIIVAARPSVGKSAFVLKSLLNVANDYGKSVGLFSMEQPYEEIIQRLVAFKSGLSLIDLRKGDKKIIEDERYVNAIGSLSDLHIHVDTTPGMSITELRVKATRLKRESKIDILYIDYLTFIKSTLNDKTPYTYQIGEITTSLKALAKELNIPIVLLAQIGRDFEKRKDLYPRLSDLKDSGSIEQDGDVVIFLHRPDKLKNDGSFTNILVERALVIVGKHRNGPTGVKQLDFSTKHAEFSDREENMQEVEVDELEGIFGAQEEEGYQ